MPHQSIENLIAMGGGYSPLSPGLAPSRFDPMVGLPLPGGLGGMGAALALSPVLQGASRSVGMTSFGAGQDQNLYDVYGKMRYQESQMAAMRMATEADRVNFMSTLRGMASLTGTPFGGRQYAAANRLAGMAASASPLLADFAPDLLDAMGGRSGSATVMTRQIMDASRYRIDPVSGRMGYSAESGGAAAVSLFEQMYSPLNRGAMAGTSAGQAGQLFAELQARGMVGYSQATQRPGIPTAGGGMLPGLPLSTPQIDQFMQTPGVAEQFRASDTSKIRDAIRQRTAQVAAMREIFGDAGHPNAPMRELIQGLEALTGGGMGQVDSSRLSGMVRQTYYMAKSTGTTLDTAMMMQNDAASRGRALGLEPIFAAGAVQSSLAFGGAARAMGVAATPAWGGMTVDQLTQLNSGLYTSAAASNVANRLGVAYRMADLVGSDRLKGSGLEAMMQAATAGGESFNFRGRSRSLRLSDSDVMDLADEVGIQRGTAFSMLGQNFDNRRFIEANGLAGVAQRQQRPEILQYASQAVRSSLFAALQERGLGNAQGVAGAAAAGLAGRMFDLPSDTFRNDASRNAELGRMLQSALPPEALAAIAGGRTGEDRDRAFQVLASSISGNVNTYLSQTPFGNMQNAHPLVNRNIRARADRMQADVAFSNQIREAMSPLGTSGLLVNAVDALQEARVRDSRSGLKVLSGMFGGVSGDRISQALVGPAMAVADGRRELTSLGEQLRTATDPAQRANISAQIETKRRALADQAKVLADMGDRLGAVGGVPPELAAEAREALRDAVSTSQDAALAASGSTVLSDSDVERLSVKLGTRDITKIRAAAAAERRDLPGRASREDVDRFMAARASEGITRAQAQDYLNDVARGGKIGVTPGDLSAIEATYAGSQMSPFAKNVAAARAALEGRAGVVSNEEVRVRSEYLQSLGRPSSADDARNDILLERRKGAVGRYGDYARSDDGKAAAFTLEAANAAVDSMAARLSSPEAWDKLGMRAGSAAAILRNNQQDIRDMARRYAGGDIGRLRAGILDPSISGEKRAKIMSAVAEIDSSQGFQLSSLAADLGTAGRGTLGDEAAAAKRALSPVEYEAYRPLSPEDSARVVSARRNAASMDNAARLFGYDPARASPLDEANLNLMRFGDKAGVVRAVLGRNPASETESLSILNGGMSRERAARMLGLDPSDPSPEAQGRISAAVRGVGTLDYAEGLAGMANASVSAEERKAMAIAAHQFGGIAGGTFARYKERLPASGLSEDAMTRVSAMQARMGAESEALLLMGKTSVPRGMESDYPKFERTRRGVETLRSMTPEEREAAKSYMEGGWFSSLSPAAESALSSLRSRTGATDDDLRSALEVSGQYADAQAEHMRQTSAGPDEVLKRFAGAYGVDESRMGVRADLLAKLGNPDVRGTITRATQAREMLKKEFGAGGVGGFRARFDAAKGDPLLLEQLRGSLGIDRDKWSGIRSAAETESLYGMTGRAADLANLVRSADQTVRPKEGQGGGGSTNISGELRGVLTLVGDQASGAISLTGQQRNSIGPYAP